MRLAEKRTGWVKTGTKASFPEIRGCQRVVLPCEVKAGMEVTFCRVEAVEPRVRLRQPICHDAWDSWIHNQQRKTGLRRSNSVDLVGHQSPHIHRVEAVGDESLDVRKSLAVLSRWYSVPGNQLG